MLKLNLRYEHDILLARDLSVCSLPDPTPRQDINTGSILERLQCQPLSPKATRCQPKLCCLLLSFQNKTTCTATVTLAVICLMPLQPKLSTRARESSSDPPLTWTSPRACRGLPRAVPRARPHRCRRGPLGGCPWRCRAEGLVGTRETSSMLV